MSSLPGWQKRLAAAVAGAGKVSLLETGFLSRSACRVSAMASVLGTSRGSGGLSSQLKCKSKRRRRRRSKRKGKDVAFCAASANCTLVRVLVSGGPPASTALLWGAGGASVQRRARQSSDPFVKGWGLLRAQRGQGRDQSSGLSKAWAGSRGGTVLA